MEPFKRNFNRIITGDDVNDTIEESRKFLSKTKKPVKFTWKGAADLLVTMSNTPLRNYQLSTLMDKSLPRVTDLAQGKDKPQEKDYIDFFEDMEKSIFGGAQNIGYSFGDIITTGIDMGAAAIGKETNLTERLTEVYEENKIEEPETLLGSISKVLIQYGVPGGAVFKVMNRARKALNKGKRILKPTTKLEKGSQIAKRAGYMATAFAATDYIAAEPGRGNLLTNFVADKTGVESLKLEDTENLEGSELALARFRNRLRYGVEGGLIGGGFTLMGKPLAFGAKYGLFKPAALVAGVGLKTADLGVSGLSFLAAKATPAPLAKKIKDASSFVVDKAVGSLKVGTGAKQMPKFEDWRLFSIKSSDPLERRLKSLDNKLSFFRSVGRMTDNTFQISTEAKTMIKARSRTIEKYLESIEKKSYDLAKSFENQYNSMTSSPASQDYYLDNVLAFLKGQIKKQDLPIELQDTAAALNKELIKTKETFANLLPAGDLKNFMLNNVKTYMRKSFSTFTNPEYQASDKIKEAASKWILNNVVKRNKDIRESAINTLKTNKMTNEQALKEMSDSLMNKILTNTKQDAADPLRILQNISKNILRSDKLIKTGEELPDVIKKLLGEENNLKASVLQTTSHAITQAVNKQTLDKLAEVGIKEGWLFRSSSTADAKKAFDAVKVGEIKGIGLLKSNVSKLYASADMAEAIKGAPGRFDGLLQSGIYRNLLQLKVATQFGKTVLSPVTQVRNVTSASMFPLANGHIGGRASVTESLRMTIDDIFGAGKVIDEEKFIKNVENKIRLGVLDENVVASELKAVLKEIKAGAKVKSMDSLLAKLANTKMAKTATRIYAGGDNLWKWYGHEYVKSQMRGIYNSVDDVAKWYDEIVGRKFDKFNTFTGKAKTFDDAIDEAAAWQIRNTYPTYSLVPQIIQDLRKLPFGNFVSFPAEMIRTTYNILSLGAKEALSSNAKLRQIGYRRLIGASVVLGGAEKGVTTLAQNLTGTTIEQIEAYKRSLSAPWNSRAAILPLNKWKDGVGKAINFSYFSPYDVVTQPASSLLKTIEEGSLKQQDVDKVLFNIINPTGDGPVAKLLSPFISEAIAFEKWNDVAPAGFFTGGRGGVTKTGSKVYSENDDPDVKITKSIAHFIRGVRPTAIDTGSKLIEGLQKDIKRGGQIVSLQDELLALLSGVRIINVNVPQTMEFKITDYNSSIKKVTESEKFYSLQNFRQRGPLVMAEEFRNIQDEAFKINQNFYFLLQDALTVGVPEEVLIKLLRKRRIPYAKVKKLLRGQNIPFTGYEKRMKIRVRQAETKGKELGEEGQVVPEYFYPKNLFKEIVREYKGKSLIPQPKEEEETFEFQKFLPNENNQQSSLQIQTPPLGNTPQPIVRTVQANVNPNTNLTRTQTALLSPEEQVIASRTT
jgi:hypothetical protein